VTVGTAARSREIPREVARTRASFREVNALPRVPSSFSYRLRKIRPGLV
jgi:hypothetical protein